MVQCYRCEDRKAMPKTNRGLCAECDPAIETSEEAIIEAAKELAADPLFGSVTVKGEDVDEQ